ncbi:hypothetical protein FALBO_16258 [Fusarium albosuccineum]|uniref:Uncharacterized protein n=1 Tax=Fusarium albosuccineum TaxID=1237068 RepID=A0A8H4P8K9_9HYPO|nr:hypothetical protein FALBO_16258 [Fusarium albosuccineum]
MQLTTLFSVATAALASTAAALPAAKNTQANSAVANLDAVKGSGANQVRTPIQIPFGKLTTFDLQITGLEITGVTVNVEGEQAPDSSRVRCRRYRDQYAIKLGSAEFKQGSVSGVSADPADFGWVLCWITD